MNKCDGRTHVRPKRYPCPLDRKKIQRVAGESHIFLGVAVMLGCFALGVFFCLFVQTYWP